MPARIQHRIDTLPKPRQDIGWKAQARLCKRFRRLTARGTHANAAVTAIARELIAFMSAIAKEVPLATKRASLTQRPGRSGAPVNRNAGGRRGDRRIFVRATHGLLDKPQSYQ